MGIDFVSTTYVTPEGVEVPVKLWDTAGQERFRSMTRSFYKQANGLILVFDLTKDATFKNVKNWMADIYAHADPQVVKVLVGNKVDMEDQRSVTFEEAKKIADSFKMPYFETSARENINV